KKLSGEAEGCLVLAVDYVPRDGMPDSGEVNPDLVSPPGLKLQPKESKSSKAFDDTKSSGRVPTFRHDPHLLAIIMVPADRRFNRSHGRSNHPVDERQVFLVDQPAG